MNYLQTFGKAEAGTSNPNYSSVIAIIIIFFSFHADQLMIWVYAVDIHPLLPIII